MLQSASLTNPAVKVFIFRNQTWPFYFLWQIQSGSRRSCRRPAPSATHRWSRTWWPEEPSVQPMEPAALTLRPVCQTSLQIFLLLRVLCWWFFLLSIGFLKRANKRLWLHSLTILSSQSLVYKVCKNNCFPPPRVFKLIFHWGKIFWTQTLHISLFSPRKKKIIPSQTPCLRKIAKKKRKTPQSFKCGFYYSVGLQGTINKLPHFPYVDYISKPL